MNGHLLDVGGCIDRPHQQIGHGAVEVIDEHPHPAGALKGGELPDRQWLVAGDRIHPEVAKHRAGCPLEITEPRQVRGARAPDHLLDDPIKAIDTR